MRTTHRLLVACLALVLFTAAPAFADAPVGVAAVDVTPDYPIRLSGFGARRAPSEGVYQRIWAKAIAIGADDAPGPVVIVTVDSTGVPDYIRRDVADRLAKKAKLDPSRFAITSSHTHTAPMVSGVLRTLFGRPVTPDEQKHIDRYTRELADNIEKAALAALADRKPAKLEFGIGTGNLAMNRRNKDGPSDHDLPVLVVRDAGTANVRAVYVSYACHCVTLSHNKIGGDWAGYLQETLQQTYPGAIALTSIGCGADQNPTSGVTGDKVDVAAEQGKRLAAEIERLVKAGAVTPVEGELSAKAAEIELMFDTPPTREEFQKRVDANTEYVSYHAKAQIERLDRGEQLQTKLPYLIQTFTFGDDLAMVFLPGEVVVDYSLRLKRDFDRSRLWINAYANDVPCYIPSERVLKEAGYEGAGAMTYYDRPTKLAPGLEQKIVDEVHRQLPKTFAAPKGTEGTAPRSALDSLKTIRTKPGLEVELVAAEPLVQSPVAIDWDARGRMWVCEMYDYPTGADQNWQPGGRVKVLEDSDDDGRFDKATVFLANLPFPTGVTAWGRGVLVCAAPDILYAEDGDGDGKADKVEKLFTGFNTENYQARVNSLSIGLDNWVHGANGLLGGTITSARDKKGVDIRNHDFRFRAPGGPLEPVSGLTQQGRVRDDWGRWFGCDNSSALRYFPHEDRYLARNPHAPAPPAVVMPPGDYNVGRLYPISRLMERFNNPGSANAVTSACGLGVYRDTVLGEQFYGNAFVCEPVHNLVHRMILTGDEPNLSRKRAADEQRSEFLASTDNWFRPVQVRTGPDGALYVVDMYRFLIEHPRWIPAERLAQIDARAGAEMGRIYRVRPAGTQLRRVADMSKLSPAELAEEIDSPNGTERDRAHVELLSRTDHGGGAVEPLRKLATGAAPPQVRVHALSVLQGLDGLDEATVDAALRDSDPQVRKHAVRLAESRLKDPAPVMALVDDASPVVRQQVASSLGEWRSPEAGRALAALAVKGLDDAVMRTAVLSSAGGAHCGEVLSAVMATDAAAPGRAAWVAPLVATAAASDDPALLKRALAAVLPADPATPSVEQLHALASLLDALQRKQTAPDDTRIDGVLTAARRIAADSVAPAAAREAAVGVLGRGAVADDELALLCRVAADPGEPSLRNAALSALRRQSSPAVADLLLKDWIRTSPGARAGIIDLLIGRDAWAKALLESVRRRVVKSNELSLADRQRLAASGDADVKRLAAELFPAGAKSPKAETVARYLAAMTDAPGDAAKGRELFAQHCAACHHLDGVGHAVGPDLAAQRGKDAGYFVQNILDPGAIVEPRFANYQVVLKDRRTLAGVITAETPASLTLAAGNGVSETVARIDVKDIRVSPISMMPEGFEEAMTPGQMAGLLAFLRGGGAKRKTMPGNAPAVVVAATKDGAIVLPAAKAEIFGGDIAFETQFGNVGMWHGGADHVAWTARVGMGGEYDVHLDYACADNAAGNAFVVEFPGDRKVSGKVAPTGSDWSSYRQVKLGTVRLEPGNLRVVVRPAGDPVVALMDLRTLALVPAGSKPPRWPNARRPDGDGVARDPASLAKVILDPARPAAAREAAVNANPQFAAELIAAMTADLPAGAPEKLEYERIPWIWRVAIAAGKRNDAGELRRVLDVSLPQPDAPLRDWQAVVIGGGVINGLSQRGVWPADRVAEIVADDVKLAARWQRALTLAGAMADNTRVRPGTRYDALRMLGVLPWDAGGEHLARYLKDPNHELQMGAVSGLGDVRSPDATRALIESLATLTDGNRPLALDALLRDADRARALLRAVEEKKVSAESLGADRRARLTRHEDAEVRVLASKLLGAGGE